jgi:hypothetical protein
MRFGVLSESRRAERRAAPKPARIPRGRTAHFVARGDRPMYPEDEGPKWTA